MKNMKKHLPDCFLPKLRRVYIKGRRLGSLFGLQVGGNMLPILGVTRKTYAIAKFHGHKH